MGTNPLHLARWTLAAGCVAAGAMLFLPTPPASPQFLAAQAGHRSPGAWESETLLADSAAHPASLLNMTAPTTASQTKPAPVLPRTAVRVAAAGSATPLAGLSLTVPLHPSATALPGGVAQADVASPQPVPQHRLVPEPTPEPDEPTLAEAVRSLRREVLQLAQAAPPATAALPVTPAVPTTAAETQRILDELRDAQRFTILQDQIRQLQTAPATAVPPAAAPAVPPTAVPPTAVPPSAVPVLPVRVPVIQTQPGTGDRFTLKVDDADLPQVLDLLGQMAGWNVVVAPGVSGPVSLNLRDVTLHEALDAVLSPRNLVAERKDNLLFVYSQIDAVARAAGARVVVTKVYRPNYIGVLDLQALVTPLLTPIVGKVAVTQPPLSGLAIDAETAGGDNLAQRDALIVQDYPEVLEEIDNILLEMDIPPRQVVIEAVILKVRLDDSLRFGVNFALLADNGRQLITTGSNAAIGAAAAFAGAAGAVAAPATTLPGFASSSAGLKYGFLRGDVAGFIEALENISETSLVASPQLRVLNKQKAELIIGQRLGYRTRTFLNQQTIENVQFLDVGTKLILRPYAAPDGLVRMEIHPERSSGFIDGDGLPQVDTTEVTTNVMVRDGTTVVIGGLIDETTDESVSQVPLLGSIPYLGALFRNKNERLIRNELIVLITPRIVVEEVEATRGEVVRAESERQAAYFADNLSPVSRRNLARLHTNRAAELLAAGRLTEAHDSALHALKVRPSDGEALRLKDRIEFELTSRTRRILGLPLPPGSPDQCLPPVPSDLCPPPALEPACPVDCPPPLPAVNADGVLRPLPANGPAFAPPANGPAFAPPPESSPIQSSPIQSSPIQSSPIQSSPTLVPLRIKPIGFERPLAAQHRSNAGRVSLVGYEE